MAGVTRRWVVSALLAGTALPACANAPQRAPLPPPRPERSATGAVAPQAAALIEAARLGGQVGYALADAATGEILEAHQPDLPLPPASVLKAVTAAYALEFLGHGHRFATRLIATGPVAGGQVRGDLVLAGGGDPTLATDDLAALAQALRGQGVTGVAGRFLVDGAALPSLPRIDAAQPVHVGYNPAVSGINLNYNRVHFRWRRSGAGHEVVMDAPGSRHNARVSMATMRVENRSLPLYTHSLGDGVEHWTVARPALGDSGSRWLPTRLPEHYAGDVFRSLARTQGTTLPAPQPARNAAVGTVLAQRASDDLGRVLRDMLRWSTNLTAEVVGLAAAQARGARPAGLEASGRLMADWAGARFGPGPVRLVDHSGLGDASRVSPVQMVRFLATPGMPQRLRGLMRDFQMRDGRGNPVPNHPLDVAAKTGTLNFVSGLAGYLRPPGGRELAFAIFAANLEARDRIPVDQRERPAGGREWSTRARQLQQALIERWGALHA